MQTNSILLTLVTTAVLGAAPLAMVNSADETATPPPAEAAQETGPERPAEDKAQTEDSVGGQMGEVSLEKFIPTEEISADGAVSFPVDI